MNYDLKELFISPDGVVWVANNKGVQVPLTPENSVLIEMIDNYIRSYYTEAHAALCKIYRKSQLNIDHYRFLRVKRFIRCNLGTFDNVPDICSGGINLEYCSCPLRGGDCEYENVVCTPKPNIDLTPRQYEVLKLHYMGATENMISAYLSISQRTVKHLREQGLERIGVNNLREFNKLATKLRIYE